jgi:hypothetical protein
LEPRGHREKGAIVGCLGWLVYFIIQFVFPGRLKISAFAAAILNFDDGDSVW